MNGPSAQAAQIKALFLTCVQLPEAQRAQAMADSGCTEAVQARVRALLRHATGDDLLGQAAAAVHNAAAQVKTLEAGEKFGDYVLQRRLGHGGQAEVWLAARDCGDFEHRVAIKVLKPLPGRSAWERFQTERALLADLRHPNIAQLLGGGQLDEQRPFMVLELVEGPPLLQHISDQGMGLRDILACFLQVCEALEYAHSHRVIHRDLKPGNVLVTPEGVVKVLDFGIARRDTEGPEITETSPLLTLAYCSPEQITGARVSTASDIYSLGLLLHEMLSARRAHAAESSTPAELMREITEQTPLKPSQALRANPEERPYNARVLHGDLDNLVMMALRKEPQRRYATVSALAQDVRRFLQGRPLEATGNSLGYTLRKALSRNPVSSALTLALLGLLIALPVMLWRNQAAVLAQSERAEQQRLIATRTTDFLVQVLESASPLGSRGEAVALADVLANAERQLAYGLDDVPAVKADLLDKLAGIQFELGHIDRAIEYYRQALPLHRANGEAVLEFHDLGQLALMLFYSGDVPAAQAAMAAADAFASRVSDPVALGWHRTRQATLALNLGEEAAIVENLEPLLAELKAQGIEDAGLLARIHRELANVTRGETALAHINESLRFTEQQLGRMHPKYAIRLRTRALALNRLGRVQAAETDMLESIGIAEKLYGRQHPEYAEGIAELAFIYHDQGRFSAAEGLYSEALAISEARSGVNSTAYVLQTNNLGYLYEDMGALDRAEEYYRASLHIRQTVFAENRLQVARSQSNLARLLAKRGAFSEAGELLQMAMALYREQQRSNLYNAVTQVAIRAGNQATPGDCDGALAELRELLPELQLEPAGGWRRMQAESWLGRLALQCGDVAQGEALLRAALDKADAIYTSGSDGQALLHAQIEPLLASISAANPQP